MKAVFPVSMFRGGIVGFSLIVLLTMNREFRLPHDTPFDPVIKIRDGAVARP